jgi:prepilin-type processing-associated H-X9-DG protein
MTEEDNTEQRSETLPKRTSPLTWAVASLAVIGGVIAAMLPGVRSRDCPTRAHCSRNLQKIALAVNNYAAKYGCFPPAYTVDKQGRRMHSWRTLVLEFLDSDLYAQYDFSRPWDSPENLAFAKKMGKNGPYRCPSEDIQEPSWTSYVMLVGPRAFSNGRTGRKLEEITDGPDVTIAVVEMSPSGILWTSPYDLDTTEMSCRINDPDHACPRSCHSGGLHVLFADGHTAYLGTSADVKKDEEYLKALITINGGEDMSKY